VSRSWANGSTRAWRVTRALVLARDRYQCRLRIPGVCIGEAPLRGRMGHPAGHVHHTHGRATTGDDPAHMVAACRPCNLAVGDPTRKPDPDPRPVTRW
jgi:5-methylcytosine-specific restriction endonuclease McrA